MQPSFNKTIKKICNIMQWTTKSIYVDDTTGEIISKELFKTEYIQTKKTRDAKNTKKAFHGEITFTYYGRKKPYKQLEILFP